LSWLQPPASAPSPCDGVSERVRAAAEPGGVDALIDQAGPQYLDLAVSLGVRPNRIETVVSSALARELGVKTDGSVTAAKSEIFTELAELIATGAIELPIATTYPPDRVIDAFTELERRHTRGKIVLIPRV
jgi:NADPH:quinone reductase